MTIQQAIVNYLLEQSNVTDLVSNRIFTNHLPQKPEFPAITIRLVSADHGRNLDGPNGVVRARIQIEAWSKDFLESQDIAEQVRTKVQGYSGLMDELLIRSCGLEEDIDTPEPPDDDSDEWFYSKALIFSMLYIESIPAH
ncbi:hypothetical protein C5Y96_09850 [Blastopirellula marina]|uniref:DUF3168 domain-containing protein n=1 Tax=Blastopirellula marina TaxID=124 RepID=A0A2S8FLW0_9BACT|nr:MULTISPECIES: DUF3168 domain-containing protein [Pirellulaceae]PQO33153.1 hypothetical protein C5Y96_09850 [Blastopirellula marina]RCS52242.1 DUF3168 domain-containing protein [Bremerella cremea]